MTWQAIAGSSSSRAHRWGRGVTFCGYVGSPTTAPPATRRCAQCARHRTAADVRRERHERYSQTSRVIRAAVARMERAVAEVLVERTRAA